jgi:hypothetical protein
MNNIMSGPSLLAEMSKDHWYNLTDIANLIFTVPSETENSIRKTQITIAILTDWTENSLNLLM